jgi:hypothetical protein
MKGMETRRAACMLAGILAASGLASAQSPPAAQTALPTQSASSPQSTPPASPASSGKTVSPAKAASPAPKDAQPEQRSSEPISGKLIQVTEREIQVQSKDFTEPVIFAIEPPVRPSGIQTGDVVVVVFRWEKERRLLVTVQRSGTGDGSGEDRPANPQEYGKTSENLPVAAPAASPASPPVESANVDQPDQGISFGVQGVLLQEKLAEEIRLTKTTADRSDIVTAGDVVQLNKDGLMMCSTDSPTAYVNTYSNGALTSKGLGGSAIKGFGIGKLAGGMRDGANSSCSSRKFVAGEKFWVTGVKVQKDGVSMRVFSDPYNDVRYYGDIKFPFQRGAPIPPANALLETVKELVSVVPQEGVSFAMNAAPAASMAAVAPPLPPPDMPPPTIAIGQTKEQVVTALGQPKRIVILGKKEIYYYPDFKVIFTNGKVSDVQ